MDTAPGWAGYLPDQLLFQRRNAAASQPALKRLKEVAAEGGNVFEELLMTVQVCSLGQITHALYEVGGQYRRHM